MASASSKRIVFWIFESGTPLGWPFEALSFAGCRFTAPQKWGSTADLNQGPWFGRRHQHSRPLRFAGGLQKEMCRQRETGA